MKPGPRSIPPALAPTGKAERVYINLGRVGDALASVPLCHLYWKETGKKAALMVAREFSSFLEGITYIQPELWNGDWRDVLGARARCRMMGFKEILVPQVYGYNLVVPHTQSSFLLESWNKVGRLNDFGAPLVFDNRNYPRETIMTTKLPKGKPIVLMAIDGTSSPLPYRDQLLQEVTEFVGDRANVVDLKAYRTEHFHDFLGVMDMAACLVTIDTGFGQLACASKVPVVALAADKPGTWYSSPKRPQHVAYVRYNEYAERKQEIFNAIDLCIGAYDKPVIHHVWTGTMMSGDAQRRHRVARQTWQAEAKDYKAWHDVRVVESLVNRSAKSVGDEVPLPFVHDMVNLAAVHAKDDDIIMLTNADICLAKGLSHGLAERCARDGATYCYRRDFPRLNGPIDNWTIGTGSWYVGCDLFAFTKRWWLQNRDMIPPFVIGRECWDWVFRERMRLSGCKELKDGIYHEKHASPWEMRRDLKGNLHNRSHARAWLTKHKIGLAEIKDQPYFEV